MTRPPGRGEGHGGDGWEQRAADLASEVQRWLIRRSARNMRDEFGDQVRRAFRGQDADPADVWETATTEPPDPVGEAPECAWCPVCRAARRIGQTRAAGGGAAGSVISDAAGSVISDAADVMTAAIKEVLAGVDSVLSYRPQGEPPNRPAAQPAGRAGEPVGDDQAKGRQDGPDHRG